MVRFKVPKCLTLLEAFRRPLNLPKDSANSAVLRYFYASPLRAWTGMPNAHGTSCRRSEGRDRENGDGILVMNGVAVLVHACLLFLFHCCLSCWLFEAQIFVVGTHSCTTTDGECVQASKTPSIFQFHTGSGVDDIMLYVFLMYYPFVRPSI